MESVQDARLKSRILVESLPYLRKFGGARHSGYGLGFERAVMYLTGVSNIRDVLPYPRTVKNAEF